MKIDPNRMLDKHQDLIQSDHRRVTSHMQRVDGDWHVNTIMIEGVTAPFKYKRLEPYKSLKGARVNITYYRETEQVAGIDFEVMRVVRIRVA